MNLNFGNILHAFRTDKQLSQKRVAEDAGLHDSYVSLLELNKRGSPSRAVVYSLSSALDLEDRERNMLLIAAGYTPDDVRSLLFEPMLADLDDVISNLPEAYRIGIVDNVSKLLALGQELLAVAPESETN